ncbi:MAG: hypothetical protein KA987_14690, partial [Saprospiraceae bacterium]|nr:hypothetical protein [Saprospiraceae bacterium]
MPVKGSCLLFDTPLKEALFDAVELLGYERVKDGKSASIQSIYSTLRAANIEVDLPTVGEIYNEVLPRDDANFSSEIEIEDYVGRTWNNELNRLVESEDIIGENQIGDQKPEKAVVEMLMKALYGDMVQDNRTTSDMKALQTALQNGIKRKLGKLDGKPVTKQGMVDLIEQALSWEAMGVEDVNGKLNSIEDLFNNMKRELENASDQISDSADQNVIDRWEEYVKNLQTASYQLLFRQKDAIAVRNEALINKEFGVNGKDVLDWNKLSAYGSLAQLRKNANDAFLDAGYSNNVATRLVDTLEQEFIGLRAETLSKQLAKPEQFASKGKSLILQDAGLDALLNGRTMSEWVKDQNVETVEDLAEKAYNVLDKTEYHSIVKKKIVQKLEQFFNENYAKVNQAEAQRVIDDILDDKSALEWIKGNGIQNQDELYDVLDKALSGRDISPQNDVAIRSEFNRILDVNNRAEKELRQREERADKYSKKGYTTTKSDLKRLIELYHLGVFDSNYQSSLHKTLGVDSLNSKDLKDIDAIAKVASDLARAVVNSKGYDLKSEAAVATQFQTLQRLIDRIIERNINNKTKTLKILSWVRNYLNVMLSSLLALPFTIVENMFSGLKAVLSGVRFDTFNINHTKQAFRVYFSMLSDVTRTGQAFGEEIGSFATQELYLNTLKFKWKNATPGEIGKSILLAATMPIRIGLLAFDSANKVALTNKVFSNSIYTALVKSGLYSKEQAKVILNDTLHGQSFEDAKVLAREIAEKTNSSLPAHLRTKITDAYVVRLANDVVKANIATSGVLSGNAGKVVMDAVVKGSYHVAGLSLGHEPNNPMSRAIKNYRDGRRQNEQKYIKDRDWKGLNKHRMVTTAMDNFVIQFAGGATNWLVLRLKEGIPFFGVAWGLSGDWNKNVSYNERNKNLKQDIQNREKARADIARNVIGMTYAGLFTLLGFSLLGGDDDEERKRNLAKLIAQKDKTQKDYEKIEILKEQSNAYTRLKANKDKDKWFRKLAPDLHYIRYSIENHKDKSELGGIIDYVKRSYFNGGQFGVTAKLENAGRYIASGDYDAAKGALASIIGEKFSTPMYRPYKEYIRVVTNPFTDNPKPPPSYVPPTNLMEGFTGGGLLSDLGFFDNPSITAIPGIGPKGYERFKKKGIKNIDDLSNRNWLELKDENGFIIPV